ncbi:LLM class flavin-dependent oxidoreductase [Isoptericola sp. b441]|uniref:LLM class flavin-dependent oxidoreductase n=1 Tax=Actinotalea lenta TaxID=3064654 RepID=A0ABT9DBB3_9CELL|nr:LLM class flavin-dependent oxidoreductase [Isoptericola sp. b441]MDO8108182.1 LLM class flavin-dependent oxidoreductase [Isoptericola sp. b441]
MAGPTVPIGAWDARAGRGGVVRFGFVGTQGPPSAMVGLAELVEEAGWDGFFTWDALAVPGSDGWDPWALLASAAVRTSRVRLGAMVFAPARHAAATLARQVQTVDHLSGGRLVLPVGLGVDDDAAYSSLGREISVRDRAAALDDALAVLEAAAEGGSVTVHGRCTTVEDVTFAPGTVQRPRVPVWVVGAWPSRRSLERAAHWDGLVVQRLRSHDPVDDEVVRGSLELIGERREAEGRIGPYEVVVSEPVPEDPAEAADRAAALADWGVTWWVHADWAPGTPLSAHLARAGLGPPTI